MVLTKLGFLAKEIRSISLSLHTHTHIHTTLKLDQRSSFETSNVEINKGKHFRM